MQARIICMASAKGGSGKTSLTATFATFLSKLNKRVLMVDADPATNGLTLLHIKEVLVKAEVVRSTRRQPISLHHALSALSLDEPDILQLSETLHFLPATYNLQDIETAVSADSFDRMKRLSSWLRGKYDFIFIDSQAGADQTAQLMMNRDISDEVVIVSEYDPMSAAGVERLKGILRNDLTYERTWVLLNKILPEFAESFSDFLEVAKYLSPIPWEAEVVRAYARRRLAVDTESGNSHTLAVLQTLRGLVGDSTLEELEQWVQTRAAVIRQPIEQQYADAEKEMATLLQQTVEQAKKRRIALLGTLLGGTLAISAAAFFIEKLLPLSAFKIGDTGEGWLPALAASLTVVAAVATSSIGRRVLGLDTVATQVERKRTERQLDLVQQRLKQLELLRTLDPESLLQRNGAPREKYGRARVALRP